MDNNSYLPALRAQDIERLAGRHGLIDVRVFNPRRAAASHDAPGLNLLVRMGPDRDLLDVVAFKQRLEDCLRIPIRVITEDNVPPDLREEILAQAKPVKLVAPTLARPPSGERRT
jgi:predicted nucleotidyltransferase